MRALAASLLLFTGCAIGLGEPCVTTADCNEGLQCAKPNPAATSGVCDYPLKTEGEPCTVAAECENNLTCSNHFTPNTRYGTCTQPRATGEPCFTDRDCQSGTCQGATEAELGTCS